MANPKIGSRTAGGPPGVNFAGPIHITTSRGSTPNETALSCLGPFTLQNLVTNQTDTVFQIVASAFSSVLPLSKGGSVVGMSVAMSATFTASAPTINVRINDSDSMTLALSTGALTATRFTTNLTSFPFSASDSLKVTYDSAAAMAPETVDVSCFVWIT